MFPGQKLGLCLTSTLSLIMSIKHMEPPLLQPHIMFESCYGQHTEFPNQTSVGGTFFVTFRNPQLQSNQLKGQKNRFF